MMAAMFVNALKKAFQNKQDVCGWADKGLGSEWPGFGPHQRGATRERQSFKHGYTGIEQRNGKRLCKLDVGNADDVRRTMQRVGKSRVEAIDDAESESR